MPDMNGAKLSLTNGTGHTEEYEIVRVGTMREHRDLLKAHELRGAELVEVRDASDALKQHAGNTDLRLAEMAQERDRMKTERDHAAATLAGVGEARDSALASVEEIIRQRDEALENLATAEREQKEAAAAAEIDEQAVKQNRERIAGLLSQLDGAKDAFRANIEEVIGALGDLS
jgi:predicted phage tail protein